MQQTKFNTSPAPFLRSVQKTSDVLWILLLTLLFVAIWGIVNTYTMFGMRYASHVILMLATGTLAADFTHHIFYLVSDIREGKTFEKWIDRLTHNNKKVRQGAPWITSIIIVLCLPANTPLFVVILSCIFAEFFGKLVFGGFSHNIFNPAATGFVFALLAYGALLNTPPLWWMQYVDAVSTPTPMAYFNNIYNFRLSAYHINHYFDYFGGLLHMSLGLTPGSIGETSLIAIVIAFAVLAYKRVLDWTVPVFYLGTIFISAFFVSSFALGGFYGIQYGFLHVISGGALFCAVFMSTDPVTNPLNRQGRIIFAIGQGILTLIIRLNSSNVEGVAYSLLLMNMLVPMINTFTYNQTHIGTAKKVASIITVFIIGLVALLLLTIMYNPVL